MDLKTLCELNGVSGSEGPVRKAILEAARPLCDSAYIDKMGNVICHKKSGADDAPHILLAAHMDEVGFIIVGHTEDGMLRFRSVGGIDPRVIISKWVKVGEVPGVIGAKAIHLQSPADRQKVLGYDGLYIDIGAKDKAEAEGLCPLGAYASFDTSYQPLGDLIVSKALDDRVGCYNLLRLLKNEYPCDITAAFVSQEEVGLRGSQGAGHTVDSDAAIILEGTAANDLGDVPERFHVASVGQGVAVSFMDGASIADRDMFRQMMEVAQAGGIPAQVKRGVTGGNDAGSFQRARAGQRTVVLSVPCRYIHSGSNVASEKDIDAQYQLADAFLQQVEGGTNHA